MRVEPLVFDDVPYRVEDQADKICHRSGVTGYFMNGLPQEDDSSSFEVSDSQYGVKHIRKRDGETIAIGETYYKQGRIEQ